MEYLDFVIRLEPGDPGWKARVIESPSGEVDEAFDLRIDPGEWAHLWFSQADRVRRPRALETMAEVAGVPDLGKLPGVLFRALFSGETLRLWDWSLGKAAPGGVRLHLRFDAEEAAIAPLLPLPWELAHDPLNKVFFGRSRLTPVLRYLEVPCSHVAGPVPCPLRILLISPVPEGVPDLAVDEEARAIQEAFQGSNAVRIDRLQRARLADLRVALREAARQDSGGGFHILHFMGHGEFDPSAGTGYLLFEGDSKQPRRVSGESLAEQLQDFHNTLRLVVLNACQSGAQRGGEGRDPFAGVATALVRSGLPAVVAMQLPISDAAAVVFARACYSQLAKGEPVDVAVAEGRLAIREVEPNSFEWAVPALFSRLRDGRLFEPGFSESETPEPSVEERLWQLMSQWEEQDLSQPGFQKKGIPNEALSDQVLEQAARQVLQGEGVGAWEPVLLQSISGRSDKGIRCAARLVRLLGLFTPTLAEGLVVARRQDESPWPVEQALRAIARHDADVLPHSRRSLRRTLVRSPTLVSRFMAHPGWRRLGIAVYGGVREDSGFDLRVFHHEANALTPWVLETLEADVPPESRLLQLRSRCRTETKEDLQDLLLARIALGDHLELEGVQEISGALRRLGAVLESEEPSFEAWLDTFQGQPKRVLSQVLEWLPESQAVSAALLSVARSLSAAERLPWLVQLLKRLLRDDPSALYNLAVALDTQGAFLASSPEMLARVVTLALDGKPDDCLPARCRWFCAALDALAALPEVYSFFTGWVLVGLHARLEVLGLLPEGLTVTLQLSDRMGAREDTLRRMVASATPGTIGSQDEAWLRHPRPTERLVELATTLGDPWLRFRLYRRIVQGWPALRDTLCCGGPGQESTSLSPAALAAAAVPKASLREWSCAELGRLQETETFALRPQRGSEAGGSGQTLLALGVDARWPKLTTVVVRALVKDALALVGEAPRDDVSSSLRPVSRLGVSELQELARRWLVCREDDPRSAVQLRWRFEGVEHDSADALEDWAEQVAVGADQQAAEAEVILGNIQALRGNLGGVFCDLLIRGVPKVRRALLRSFTYLLARRRVTDAVWDAVAPVLSTLAEDDVLSKAHFVLDGPAAVVSAVGAVRQNLDAEGADADGADAEGADADGAGTCPVDAARRAYDRWKKPWSGALREPLKDLRRTLTAVGEEWLVSKRSLQEISAAAERVALEPRVFGTLLDWASEEMRRDVHQRNPDDYLLGDLLAVLASAATRLPEEYWSRLAALPLWERQLCEAAREANWFPTRRAALELLLLLPERSAQVGATLIDAQNDIAEVREAIGRLNDET